MFALQSVTLPVALLLPTPQGSLDPQYMSCHVKEASNCGAVRWDIASQTPPTGEFNPCGLFGGGDDPIQYVPLGQFLSPPVTGVGRIYMAHSTTIETATQERKNNVLMTVFELACDESADILLFGTGYGCRIYGSNESEFTAEDDALLVDGIVRGCMGILGHLDVAVVVPHGHPDHINPEFLHALEGLGTYTIDKIYVHTDDREHLNQAGMDCPGVLTTCSCPDPCWVSPDDCCPFDCWDIQTFGLSDCCNGIEFPEGCEPPDDPCCTPNSEQLFDCETTFDAHGQMLSFKTTVGRVWFRGRDGHTPGSVDLVLDHLGGTANRFVIYGSQVPGCPAKNCINSLGETPTPNCPPAKALANLRLAIPAHGNIPDPLGITTYPDCPLCIEE